MSSWEDEIEEDVAPQDIRPARSRVYNHIATGVLLLLLFVVVYCLLKTDGKGAEWVGHPRGWPEETK